MLLLAASEFFSVWERMGALHTRATYNEDPKRDKKVDNHPGRMAPALSQRPKFAMLVFARYFVKFHECLCKSNLSLQAVCLDSGSFSGGLAPKATVAVECGVAVGFMLKRCERFCLYCLSRLLSATTMGAEFLERQKKHSFGNLSELSI